MRKKRKFYTEYKITMTMDYKAKSMSEKAFYEYAMKIENKLNKIQYADGQEPAEVDFDSYRDYQENEQVVTMYVYFYVGFVTNYRDEAEDKIAKWEDKTTRLLSNVADADGNKPEVYTEECSISYSGLDGM